MKKRNLDAGRNASFAQALRQAAERAAKETSTASVTKPWPMQPLRQTAPRSPGPVS